MILKLLSIIVLLSLSIYIERERERERERAGARDQEIVFLLKFNSVKKKLF